MTDIINDAFSRRVFMRGAALSVPVVGAALVVPAALAEPSECSDPSGMVGNCAVQGPCPHVVDTGFVVMRLRAA
ncbi:hypothetical protein [Mycobacterium intracellulare]|uniref:hypothetical protein n=1 Tax=Mycobacterium intracellulare TaxID=1767 RepID=UPI001928C53D|nr:hypothetical protein [Mycobacterium intracellulare]BCO60222.1 hypothetical protein MINTM006_01720 [Mycobacterium intracellulare]BCP18384.1 hypothetical protein MINTM023_01730 [Mycobacterium intracellulare]BCP29203.1 hypothetical protein MINTM026_01730 [Mycobacterium intracellulare]